MTRYLRHFHIPGRAVCQSPQMMECCVVQPQMNSWTDFSASLPLSQVPKIIADFAKLCLYHLSRISVHCHVASRGSLHFSLRSLFSLRCVHEAYSIGLCHLLYEMSFKSVGCFYFVLICCLKCGDFLKPPKNLNPENESIFTATQPSFADSSTSDYNQSKEKR